MRAGEEEAVKAPNSQPIGYYLKHIINEKLIERLVNNHRFNDSLLGVHVGKMKRNTYKLLPRGPVYKAVLKKKIKKKEDIGGNFEIPWISKDVLVDVASYVYPLDFVILDIKEFEKRPFILGTSFLTTAKAVIKFDKGTITSRSGKSNISFHRIPKSICKIKKGIKNDIEPIAPTMTVNRLILEWEERIKLHQEKEIDIDGGLDLVNPDIRLTMLNLGLAGVSDSLKKSATSRRKETKHQKVNIFYNGLGAMNRQFLDSQGPIPGMTPVQALLAIQTMADHSQKWHDGISSRNIESVIDMLEGLNETMLLGRPFLEIIHARIDVFRREISLGIGKRKFNPLEIENDVLSYDSLACLLLEQDCEKDCGQWPTCNLDLSYCSGYDAIYGQEESRMLKQWICFRDHERQNVRRNGMIFDDLLKVSETIKCEMLKEWIKENFNFEVDFRRTWDDPYSRRFDVYKEEFDNEIEQLVNEYELKAGRKRYTLDKVWEKCKKFHDTIKLWYDKGFEEEELWQNGIEEIDYTPSLVKSETFEVHRYTFKNRKSFISITKKWMTS
nr:RNA-directed DNA polymerase, eukaryota, reverse transcriptase zinc-binding domain protein [Tanacetum cinerariifolium]